MKLGARPSEPLIGFMYVNTTDDAVQPQPGMPAYSAAHVAGIKSGVQSVCLGG